MKFSAAMIEKMGNYIYCLVDPRNQNIFYVGKGKGNRVFQHVKGALKEKSYKNDIIKEIYEAGFEPSYYFLRHNIQDEKQALEFEALAIDLLSIVKPGQQPLTNIQGGTHSSEKGLMTLSELKRLYDTDLQPQELKTDLPIILLIINRSNDELKGQIKSGKVNESEREQELYERTRKYWKVDKERKEKAKYAVAVDHGKTIAVYEISRWFKAPADVYPAIYRGRWGFEGKILPKDSPIYQELVGKLTYLPNSEYKAPQNPVSYRNC